MGFEDEMDKVTKQMQKAVPSDFSTVVNADVNSFVARPATSNVTKNSNMTVNYIFENVTINNDKDIEENAYNNRIYPSIFGYTFLRDTSDLYMEGGIWGDSKRILRV